jgi:outer membrane protein OmpA-like peptidoglycan-associated protein
VGTDASNMKLSINRAKAVADYLIMNGIPANKIVQKGYGGSQCTLPEKVKGEAKAARNARLQPCRRVDISLSLFQPD